MIEDSRCYPEEILKRGILLDETANFASHMHAVWVEGGRKILWNSDDSAIGTVTSIFRSLVPYADTEERFKALFYREVKCPFFLRPIIRLNDTSKLAAIIWKISTMVDPLDQWVRIQRSSTKTTIELYVNSKKNLYLLLPQKSSLDIGSGFVKQGRRAILLLKRDASWHAEVVWNLKSNRGERARAAFIAARVVEKKLIEMIPEEKKVFSKMLWDFMTEGKEKQKRSVFYEYWPMYMRHMCAKYISIPDAALEKRDPVVRVILLNSAKVVEQLHLLNIGHGDIKLDNFLIDYSLECRLCDPDTAAFTKISALKSGSFTPEFLSPEVLKAKAKRTPMEIDPLKEDIYALGCMFYNLFTCSDLSWEGLDSVYDMESAISKRNELMPQIEKAKGELIAGSKDIIKHLIYWMLHPDAIERPTIKDVIYWLELEAIQNSLDSIKITK